MKDKSCDHTVVVKTGRYVKGKICKQCGKKFRIAKVGDKYRLFEEVKRSKL